MEITSLLSIPEGLYVTSSTLDEQVMTIRMRSEHSSACCPLCGNPSEFVHSQYQRHLRDFPCGGQVLCLQITARKFFCQNAACARKIFVECLASLAKPWAQMTLRLVAILQAIGLATGGRLGVRITDRLGVETSRTTILRRIMDLPTKPVGPVTQIGLDDFSFRRGKKFGTIIIDLQTREVLDVLPDRTAETSATWMAEHPELEIVSRDRGGDCAAAARQAAPQATQIADRFHLYKNLTEAVELVLSRCRTEIRQGTLSEEDAEKMLQEPFKASSEDISIENWKPAQDPCVVRDRLARQAQHHDRSAQVTALRAQGLGTNEIARRVGVTPRTIQNWQKKGSSKAKPRRKHASIFDPYAVYVLSRWEQGCKNGKQICQEIKEKGYPGTEQQVYRFLRPLRTKLQIIHKTNLPHSVLEDFSAYCAVWLFVRDPEKLTTREEQTVKAICQASKTAHNTYHLVQSFRTMLHTRTGEKLDDWLATVESSQIRELQSFRRGIERDKAAVVTGLTFPQSNGIVEGNVNKLKLIKRMGYGRAGFALLRQRVLHALQLH